MHGFLITQNCIPRRTLLDAPKMLGFGSVLHGKTPFAGVCRLMAGKLLLVEHDTCAERRYHMFRSVPEHELTLEDCVEDYDKLQGIHLLAGFKRYFYG